MGADRGRDRRRRQRHDERPARRPRSTGRCRPAASRHPRAAPPSAAPRSQLAANAADLGGSGVALGRWEVKRFGPARFTRSQATHRALLGHLELDERAGRRNRIRAVITDAAGNDRTTAVVPVTVDSTGPSVTLTDPGAVVSGTVSLAATTGGGAARVAFAVSPAGCRHLDGDRVRHERARSARRSTRAPSPTASTTCAPSATTRSATPLRASVRTNVRFDNTAPTLVSSDPADGSVSTSANQIVLTASEPVTAPGALLDGVAAPAPTLRLDAHLRDRRAHRRPARPLGRARGRERHSHAVPRRSHDREHAADRSPAGGERRPRRRRRRSAGGSARHGQMPAARGRHPDPQDFLVLRVDPVLPSAGMRAGSHPAVRSSR